MAKILGFSCGFDVFSEKREGVEVFGGLGLQLRETKPVWIVNPLLGYLQIP